MTAPNNIERNVRTVSTQRVLQWHLFIEEFHPTFHYIKGVYNVIADALSRLPQFDDSITEMVDCGLDNEEEHPRSSELS